jgi:acetyl esterase/lipase
MRALLLALSLAGCAVSPPPTAPSRVQLGMYGTDAHLAPAKPDAVLRYAGHPRGFAELRLPKGRGPFPLAVIFHGGCFKAGIADQNYMAPLATRWQQEGVASLNVDYREVGDGGGWPGSFEDWAEAAKLIDTVAAKYPIDRARVTLVGHSAGALPAQWLAMAQDRAGPMGARDPLRVRAAIVFDGEADVASERAQFDALCKFPAIDPFMGGDPQRVPARYDAVSPLAHRPHLSELLFVQAVLPPAPPAVQAAIRAHGTAIEIVANPGASHFAIITPGDPVYAAAEPAVLRILQGR